MRIRKLLNHVQLSTSLVLASLVLLSISTVTAANWPQRGGAGQNFKTDTTGLADVWPDAGPRQLWKRPLGDGYSEIVVVDDRLYTMYRNNDREYVIALDAGTGETVWQHDYPAPFLPGTNLRPGPGPHATPLVVGNRVYTVGATGIMKCFDIADGTERWSHDLINDLKGTKLGRGYSASLVAYRDTVLALVGGKGRAVIAFRLGDGTVKWQKQDFQPSHSSPLLISFEERDQLVVFAANVIVAVDPADGALIWQHPHTLGGGHVASMPVWGDDGRLFLSSAYGTGSRCLQLSRDGDKTVVKEIWFNPKMRMHHSNAIRVGDYIYGSSGDFGPKLFTAIDVNNGKIAWRVRTLPRCSSVYADGKFIILDEKGHLSLARANPSGLKILSKVSLFDSRAWTAPTLVDKNLYIRNRTDIMAFALPERAGDAAKFDAAKFIDLSLMVSPEMPCTWADGFPTFRIDPYLKIGPRSAYNSDILTIDGNTGTQLDVPPHSVARPELKLPNSGPFGNAFIDKTPAWQFVGEACVVDCRDLLDTAPNGRSSLVRKKKIIAWEKKNRRLGFGDVVMLHSGYSDRYYKPLPEGRRFIAEPLEHKAPGWPDPDPDCMEFLAARKVMNMGTDSPSMGPIPDLAEPTHYAGLKHGMIWTEGATGLGRLPATGAFYCMMGPKHAGSPYGEGRAFAVVGNPLAQRLIESARKKQVVDLSVTLSVDRPVTWPGRGVGRHRHRYTKANFMYAPNLKLFHHTHILDSHAGTHLVPPAYALPPSDSDVRDYAPRVRGWLEEYEKKYGPRGTSNVTTEKVPISQTCGPARVIDVTQLVGTTDQNIWPASPEITPAHIKKYEAEQGALKPGDIVIFQSGHTDKHYKPFPEGAACMSDPINGKSEGWPAPGPEAIRYLASKKIRCVGTDGPSLGGVDERRALMTYWALGSEGMVSVEFLTNLARLPKQSYFLFAPVKIQNCHGGPGRAIALY